MVPPVLLCDLPLFEWVLFPLFEPPDLLIFIDLESEFYHPPAVFHEGLFHLIDFGECPFPLRL